MVWGGRRLGEVLGKRLPTGENYGESWEISDHPLHRSIVAGGPWAGQPLRDLMEREPAALLGRGGTFPWLVKFLDAGDWLSVQVHPDEEPVKRLWPGEGSKTEAWFVLEASPNSRVYAGLLPGVDEKALRQALARGTVAECLHSFQPRAGDCVFLPAGTVHAVGGGALMAEIQQTSDATFRLFDWNRVDGQGKARALHIEEALACIDWKGGPVDPVRKGGERERLVTCKYFELEHVRTGAPWALGGGAMRVLVVVQGRGALRAGEEQALAIGDTVLLPASLERAEVRPDGEMGVLVATLPAA
jgi:mannose-6-phosphate isomerase